MTCMNTKMTGMPDTIVEIYDDEQIYNVLSIIEWKPANVVYIGTRKLKSKKIKNNIISCLRKLGLDTKCFFYSTDMLNIDSITSVMTFETSTQLSRRFISSPLTSRRGFSCFTDSYIHPQ